MELHKAISQISEIHAQLQRTEVFSGYRALPMAVTSALAVVAAAVGDTLLAHQGFDRILRFWIGYAALSALICGADLASNCLLRGRHFRQQALFVVSQFLPALSAGILVTAVLFPLSAAAQALLPGLWTLLFAVGIFSSAPYLPRGLRWVAVFYLAAGGYLLWAGRAAELPSAWAVGMVFATGQAAVALVLHDDRSGRGH